jgi:hypothetical protein
MYVDNVSGAACDKTNLEVYTGYAASGADSERGFTVYNGSLGDFTGEANREEITGYVFDPTIGPNNSAVIQQRAQLDPSADNSFMNTDCTWDEVFVGEAGEVVVEN